MTTKPGLKFSVATIDNAKETLKALPPAPRETKEVSLREAIEELAPTIRGLLGKGYSRQQVVDLIQEQGVGCSLTTSEDVFPPAAGKTKAKSSAASTAATHGGKSGDRSGRSAAGRQRRLCRARSRSRRSVSRRGTGASSVAGGPCSRWRSRRGNGGHQRGRPSGSEGVVTRQQNVQGAAAGRDSVAALLRVRCAASVNVRFGHAWR